MQALVDAAEFYEWTLRVYRETDSGQEEHYYTIVLTGAQVSRVNTTNESTHQVFDHVSFTYTKISWSSEEGGITAEDNWVAPLS
jgi:type VI secretion system secreted protein Hcp